MCLSLCGESSSREKRSSRPEGREEERSSKGKKERKKERKEERKEERKKDRALVEPLPLPFGGAHNARASGPFAPLYATPTCMYIYASTYTRTVESLEQGMDRTVSLLRERVCVRACSNPSLSLSLSLSLFLSLRSASAR